MSHQCSVLLVLMASLLALTSQQLVLKFQKLLQSLIPVPLVLALALHFLFLLEQMQEPEPKKHGVKNGGKGLNEYIKSHMHESQNFSIKSNTPESQLSNSKDQTF